MDTPKRVLFVCVENSNRRQMAKAFARIHGGDEVEDYSAGSRLSGRVSPNAIDAMRELDYDLSQHSSKSLDDIADMQYDFVATMGWDDARPFARAKRREDWTIPDPKDITPALTVLRTEDLCSALLFGAHPSGFGRNGQSVRVSRKSLRDARRQPAAD